MSERLRRLDAVYERHPIYFVTACTAERRHLLANPTICDAFVRFAQAAAERGAWVGRYVLMPDHVHLFVTLEDDKICLSDWVGSLKKSISKALRGEGELSPHWQKGFFDHVMRGGESYSQKWDYVRENPVRAGIVSQADDWPFSGQIHELEYRKDLLL
ncbi:MAG: REP-associated tyrosine transposase [Chthoniobacterales bacterium]